MNNISNAQRAHDLATALVAKIFFLEENTDISEEAMTYAGLYAHLLHKLDTQFPKGLPEKASDLSQKFLDEVSSDIHKDDE